MNRFDGRIFYMKKKEINDELEWVPTPTYLYRNYLYKKIVKTLPKDGYFLDVGSGNGEFMRILSRYGFRGESIDTSKKAVSLAKKNLKKVKGITIKWGNIFTYNPKTKFDIVFCFEALEHIDNDSLAIKKIHGLLKPDGIFVMSVPAHMSQWTSIDKIKGHYRRYERKELTTKLTKAHFKIRTMLTYGFPFLYILRWISSSGSLISYQRKSTNKDVKSRESSITQDYDPKLKALATNPLILYPIFKFLDLFTKTDLGFGYIVVARK